VQQAESSASRMRQPGNARDGGAQGQEASVHADGEAGSQPTRAERRLGSRSLTREDKLRTATLATSSTPAVQATQRRGRRRATTPGGAGITTTARTAHRRRNPRGPACSAGRSAWRVFLRASASPPR
jgi:hypothetical protein